MSDYQKKLEEMRLNQEQAKQALVQEFKTFVQTTYPNAIATESGLHYIITEEGKGAKPNKLNNVTVHYSGALTNGKIFDTSYKRNKPFTFKLGLGNVIKGWDEGIALLNVGSKAKLIIPYFLGYGEQGSPPVIPARATLIFDVELVGAK